ncbi:hypothetical protein, partial [Bacillus mycoides]|uniref:hypothetical protein n=1 Tax=Bacillus mycoides TaxID=1405 RepID=UPI003A80CE1E
MLGKEWLTNAIAANVADYMMMKGGITVWGGLNTVSRIGEDHIADSGDFERSLKPVIDKILGVIELPEDKFEAIEVSVELERAFKGLVTSVWEAVWYKWSFAFTEYKRYKEGYAIQHTKG